MVETSPDVQAERIKAWKAGFAAFERGAPFAGLNPYGPEAPRLQELWERGWLWASDFVDADSFQFEEQADG